MFSDSPIKYFNGTHRVKNPDETISDYENKLKTAGITRLTDITDLDRVGIPVFSAIRPTAQSGGVSIYAGKGISKSHAKASAIMEGFERYSAEKQKKDDLNIIIGKYTDLDKPIDLESLILSKSIPLEEVKKFNLEWEELTEINSESKYQIPSNLIYHPYIPNKDNVKAFVKGNTNGLASGNTIEEAILHGIYEIIERDAWSIFEISKKNKKEINKDTIENEEIRNILNKFENENISIKIFDITADIEVPTILASGDDKVLKDAALLSLGVGTNLNPEISILRALTELAQSRATQIHGTREDTNRADFMRKAGYERMKKINKIYFEDSENLIDLNEIPNKSSLKTIKEDINICLDELKKAGLDKVFFKDLTREEIGVNVARVIIPNAELYALDPSRIGERAIQYDLTHKKNR